MHFFSQKNADAKTLDRRSFLVAPVQLPWGGVISCNHSKLVLEEKADYDFFFFFVKDTRLSVRFYEL